MSRPFILTLIALLWCASPAPATTRQEFDGFTERFLTEYYAFRTARATLDGIHTHDREISGYSREQIQAEIARLKTALATLTAMRATDLDSARLFDHAILHSRVQAEILDLADIRPWEKNPGYYLGLIFDSIHPLAGRAFAPDHERLRSVIEREKLIGAVLGAALENVYVPPRVMTEAAIGEAAEIIEFLETSLPGAFATVADSSLTGEFATVNAAAIRDLTSYKAYLTDLLPGSLGDFKLGPDLFASQLRFAEMCDIPVFRLENHGQQELERLQLTLKNTAAGIDRDKTPVNLLRILSIDYPKVDRLFAEADRLSADLRRFCVEKNLISIPDGITCRAVKTPFDRSLIVTDLESPGVFEKNEKSHLLHVTPPDPRLKPLEVDDAMRFFNRYQFPLLVAAETWPGTLLEREQQATVTSKVRRAFGFATFSDGWGAYSRQMVLDEGYAGAAPEFQLFQIRLAILDACRFLVAIRMHTAAMTIEEAGQFFQTQASLSRIDADREARRVALDPMSVTPLLGRLQILKLRDDYRRRHGLDTPIRDFHDGLLSFGSPPLRLLRQMLMPGDKGSAL